jgi:hypothetical protein
MMTVASRIALKPDTAEKVVFELDILVLLAKMIFERFSDQTTII